VLAFVPGIALGEQPARGPFVPAGLRAAAAGDPSGLFGVIVQARRGSSSAAVAGDVASVRAGDPGRERGTRRRFSSIAGVSAELTGRQLLRLADRPRLLAITPDGPLAAADLGTDPIALPPTVTTPPTIRGAAAWRETLSVDPGVWQTTGLQPFVYQWQRCDAFGAVCADVDAAGGSDYRVVDADIGSTIRVVVTATDLNGTSTAVSLATPVVVAYANAQIWPYTIGLDRLWPATPAAAAAAAPAIAVVDSGVDAWSAGLGDRLVAAETLTALPGNSAGDGRGHGTFVAGLAAGAAARYAGASPSARIVSLDVMDDSGMAMTSDVIAAADWIVAHKDQYDIRVANFSLIGSAPASFLYDPLDAAVERLWLSGVVVVAAAGNYAIDGADSGVLYAPGNDPFVVTVGASDLNGSLAPAAQFAAPWSAYGRTPDGFAKPEVGAPGRFLVAGIPSGSSLARELPERVVEPGHMQLSGTSFATAVTSGVVAALLEQHPDWTPDQVKGALMAGAQQTSAGLQLGVGEIDAAAAAAVADPPNPNASLETYVTGGPVPRFDADAWRAAALADPAWDAVSWGVVSWGVVSWGVVSWGVDYWSPTADAAGAGSSAESAAVSAQADGSAGDYLPAGGYWVSPASRN
jgi:serine protease AprX